MNSTPWPRSTANAAASIWSGVGDVNTWPGQAASSMPLPMKPQCSGSWPEPPPEISTTLDGARCLRVTKVGSRCSDSRSPCAAAIPCSDSASSCSTSLTNFFMMCVLEAWWRSGSQQVAHREQRDLAGLGTGVDVPEGAVAEEMGPPLGGDHVAGGKHVELGFLLELGAERVAVAAFVHQAQQQPRHRDQHVQHRLLAQFGLAPALDGLHAGRQRAREALFVRLGATLQVPAHGDEEAADQRPGSASDRAEQLHADAA